VQKPMEYFTDIEFKNKYNIQLDNSNKWLIGAASEMIYSQVGEMFRQDWDSTTVPDAIKNASMEQCRFLLEYDIPLLDNRGEIKAGNMVSDLKTDYSTLALRILSNAGYLYRGVPLNYNMKMELPF
jgi:hypothetical protein